MRCFALVQLDGEAGRLLAARARPGEESSWVHRCQLLHGHGGDHRCVDTISDCTLEWDDSSAPPRVVSNRTSADGARDPAGRTVGDDASKPVGTVTRINGAEHPSAPDSVRTAVPSRTEVQALDAIATALERICDVFSALIDDPDSGAAGIWRQRAESMDGERRRNTR